MTSKFRVTPVRQAMVKIATDSHAPMTSKDFLQALSKVGLEVNKTTVYRELEFLVQEKIIREVLFKDGIVRFEIASDHHHHLVCNYCQKVEDVDFDELEKLFANLETKLGKNKKFQSVGHSLEFFGLCRDCQK